MANEKVATIMLYPADPSKYKSNPPAYTGPATVNGDQNFRASAWKQEDKSGNTHLSVSVQAKMESTAPSGGYQKNDLEELDDKIPF